MRSPLTLTLIPIFWNIWVWMYTWGTFNSKIKTRVRTLAIMNLCAGGLGGLVADIQTPIKSKRLWFCIIIGSIPDIIITYYIFIFVFK